MKLHKFDSILSTVSTINDIKKDLSELRKYYEKRESDIIVTKQVNTKLRDQIKILECQCWTNEQYNRREWLGISGVPESVTDKDLQGKVLNLLEKKDTEVCPGNIDTCYWIKFLAGPKKVIIKMSRRNDADKF